MEHSFETTLITVYDSTIYSKFPNKLIKLSRRSSKLIMNFQVANECRRRKSCKGRSPNKLGTPGVSITTPCHSVLAK